MATIGIVFGRFRTQIWGLIYRLVRCQTSITCSAAWRKQHFAFHPGGCRCNGKWEWLAQQFARETAQPCGSDSSDSSSLPGRVAGEDYENCVRFRLTGSERKQDAARVKAWLKEDQIMSLRELEQEAAEASKKNVGRKLQQGLFGTTKESQAGSNYRVAEADAVLEEEKDLVQSLGEGCRVTALEVEAPQLIQLWKPQTMVPFSTASASSLRNTWPCAQQWIACPQLQYSWSTRNQFGAARSGYRPSTSSLSWRICLSVFCIFPHSLNITQHQQRIAEKDETIAEKDETIAEKDETIAEKDKRIAFLVFCIVLLVAYLLRIQLIPHASATRGELWLRFTAHTEVPKWSKMESWKRSNLPYEHPLISQGSSPEILQTLSQFRKLFTKWVEAL